RHPDPRGPCAPDHDAGKTGEPLVRSSAGGRVDTEGVAIQNLQLGIRNSSKELRRVKAAPTTYETGQDIRDRSFDFACRVVRFCQTVYEGGGVGRMLVPQLVNS